jgi:signal transduction histidine kinase
LVLLALVPSLTLAAIWGVTTNRILTEGLRLRSQTALSRSTGALGTDVTLALQRERRLSAAHLAAPKSSTAELNQARERTDAAVRNLVSTADEVSKAPARISDRMYPVTAAAESLSYYRGQVDNTSVIGADQILQHYTDTIDAQVSAFQELSQVDDGALTAEAALLASLEQATELVSQEDALLTLAQQGGQLSEIEYAKFTQIVGARRWLVSSQIDPFLSGAAESGAERIIASAQWQKMESIEDDIIATHAARRSLSFVPLPASVRQWRPALDVLSDEGTVFIEQRTEALLDHSSARARALLTEAAGISAGGLAAVLLCTLLSWRIARSLSRRLRGLREATLDMARTRLPDVVARLNQGERIDVDAAAPALDYGGDELGQVAQAFNDAQRTAVNTAVELAETRRGFQKVILGVARHTQNLVNRQLSTLDALEREHEDPQVLRGLYELDSTASQMRRYEENLVIISGGQPGRRWTRPVAMVDVLRSAIGEVAEYQRVTVHIDGDVRLAGPAVADVIHLLAELIENATVFSPAPSPVRVRADLVVKGLAIEVEDRGVGMSEEDYQSLNRQLADPPRFDVVALADDPRLGMFVVGRLAARHGISVTLRSSPYGGSAAIVLIPADIVVCELEEDNACAVPPPAGPGRLPPRRASVRPAVAAPDPTQPQALTPRGAPTAIAYGSDRPAATADAEGPTPLPRRVPQTSLVAELLEERPAAGPAPRSGYAADRAEADPDRCARQAASGLSAFQRGTSHARTEPEPPTHLDPDPCPEGDSYLDPDPYPEGDSYPDPDPYPEGSAAYAPDDSSNGRQAAPRHARAKIPAPLPTKDV